MKSIECNAELEQLHSTSEGLIHNDFSGKGSSGKDYNVLHAASCGLVARSNVNVPKIFFSNLDEAIVWLRENRGKEGEKWKRCGRCHAGARPLSFGSRKSGSLGGARSAIGRTDPFTEEKVERILVQYLKNCGYKVRRQIPVINGKVDVVADGLEGCWFIEVKGEDKGGYTSAEMNFQIGVRQIVSRMTDPKIFYALAFPMTSNFKKVLRKYKGSMGFERLNLWFFVTHRDGKVDKYDATTMRNLTDRV